MTTPRPAHRDRPTREYICCLASYWTLVLSLALAFLSFTLVQGQSTYGSVAGAVTDSSGAAIVNAQVALTNLGTSEKRTQSTVADGLYSFVTVIPANIASRSKSRASNT